jgi:uncharacterized protein (TIGR03067 family)
VIHQLFILLALLTASPVLADDKDAALKQLQGTWRVEALEVDGQPQPAGKGPKEIKVAGDKLTGIGPEMTLSLDPTKTPRWADLTFQRDGKEMPLRAIYEVEGDTLRLCFGVARTREQFKNERPTAFGTKGKGTALFTAKRVKP